MDFKENQDITTYKRSIINMENYPKVSIIVPVYNAGEYLQVCLNSLISQTLREIEIILVLDRPTDGSDKVAEAYAATDPRIKLIRNEVNLHTGFSRNEGIKYASGQYLGFADHDDYCDPEMFEQLYNKAVQESADVVISNYFDENPEGQTFFAFPQGYSAKEFQQQAFEALISARYSIRNSQSFNNMNVIWNQIYRRDFLLEHNIWFADNRVVTMEDVFFSIKVYHFAAKVFYLPETYYHHVNTSANNYENYSYRSIARIRPLIREIHNFLIENNILEKYSTEFTECTLKRLYSSFRNELKFKKTSTLASFFKQVRNDASVQEILLNFTTNKALLKRFAITKRFFYHTIRNKAFLS
ncbi:MAG: glycosyl transferase family 2 [Bacteroidetes bacterium]|nr:glycosyl transferase family 2 [Bacteroidota bacterium]